MKLKNNEYRTYNVLFPLWFLIWIPSYLWLILIPLNYAIDTAVTWYTIRDLEDRKQFCIHNTWKICIAGFISDLIGSAILLATNLLSVEFENTAFAAMGEGILFNPFSNIGSFIVCLFAIMLSAGLIYIIDKKILYKAGLDIDRAIHSAKWLAIITAPYLFLFPSGLLYN